MKHLLSLHRPQTAACCRIEEWTAAGNGQKLCPMFQLMTLITADSALACQTLWSRGNRNSLREPQGTNPLSSSSSLSLNTEQQAVIVTEDVRELGLVRQEAPSIGSPGCWLEAPGGQRRQPVPETEIELPRDPAGPGPCPTYPRSSPSGGIPDFIQQT